MYAHILPARKLPTHMQALTYRIPEHLRSQISVGDTVLIPFGKQKIAGIVERILAHSSYAQHKIRDIDSLVNYLTPQQKRLFEWMSANFFLSKGHILKLFPNQNLDLENNSAPLIKKSSVRRFHTFSNVSERTPELIQYETWNEKFSIYQDLISRHRNILFVLPTLSAIHTMKEALKDHEITELHSKLSKKKYLENFKKILSGAPSIILGTKNALFAPYVRLDALVVDDVHADDHKSQTYPKFHALKTSEILSKIYSARLIMTSSFPPAELIYRYTSHEISLTHSTIKSSVPFVIHHGGYSSKHSQTPYFSDEMVDQMQDHLSEKKRVVILLNQKGYTNKLWCSDCKTIVACRVCAAPLSIKNSATIDGGCEQCSSKTKNEIRSCNVCKKSNIKTFGAGILQIAAELKKIFPHVKIRTVSSEEELSDDSWDLLVGTNSAFFQTCWSHVALVIISAENTFSHNVADFRKRERLAQYCFDVRNKLEYEAPLPAQVLIRQERSEDSLSALLGTEKKGIYYQQELRVRKQMGYPPFGNLFCFSMISHDENILARESRKFIETVSPVLGNKSRCYELGVVKNPKKKNAFQTTCIIKTSSDDLILSKIAHIISPDWRIDRDPTGFE